jgi:hypothetical protein
MRGYRYCQHSGRVSNDSRYSRGVPPVRDWHAEYEAELAAAKIKADAGEAEVKILRNGCKMAEDISIDDMATFFITYAEWEKRNCEEIEFPFGLNMVIYLGEDRYDIKWNGHGMSVWDFEKGMTRHQVAGNYDSSLFAQKAAKMVNAMRNYEEPNKI